MPASIASALAHSFTIRYADDAGLYSPLNCYEDVYTSLIDDDPWALHAGARGTVKQTIRGRTVSIAWELRANAVWRFGRVFLPCPRCQGRATRIYLPFATCGCACRRCWGLTYESRQRRNYKASGPFAVFGSVAQWLTDGDRMRRAEAAAERYANRRAILKWKRSIVTSDPASAQKCVATE